MSILTSKVSEREKIEKYENRSRRFAIFQNRGNLKLSGWAWKLDETDTIQNDRNAMCTGWVIVRQHWSRLGWWRLIQAHIAIALRPFSSPWISSSFHGQPERFSFSQFWTTANRPSLISYFMIFSHSLTFEHNRFIKVHLLRDKPKI